MSLRLAPLFCLGSLALCDPTAAAAAERIGLNDFAWGIPVETVDPEALQSVLLPYDLYLSVQRADLGDLRVFNAAAEEVPHALRWLVEPTTAAPAVVKLPFFAVRGPQDGLGDMQSLVVKRSQDGTVVDIRSRETTTSGDRLLAYIVDASNVKVSIRALELRWRADPKGFAARVQVATSTDLASWQTLVGDAAVVSLELQGHTLERRRIELSGAAPGFLRLTWGEGDPPFSLTEIDAELQPETVEPSRNAEEVTATLDAKTGEYLFDIGGPLPVDRVSLDLPERNTLVEAQLLSAESPAGPWQPRYAGLVYNITAEGQEVTTPELTLSTSRHRYWLMRVDAKGGGLGAGLPRMRFRWPPEQLLFVARGDSPYTLAYGSYWVRPSTFSAPDILKLVPGRAGNGLAEQTATLGMRRELAGATALTPPPPPTPWKTWTLWAVLGLAVLFLGFMTWRLARQLSAAKPQS